MASDLNNVKFSKTRSTIFPAVETINIISAVSIILTCSGNNAVNFEFKNLGELGQIEPGETKTFVSNGDPITDDIELTFNGAAEIEASFATGVGTVPVGGSATAANQLIIISYLNGTTTSVFSGNSETPELVEVTAAGIQNTDIALSLGIIFQGTGGKLNGVTVPNTFIAEYSGTMRNEIAAITFEVPTVPDSLGNQRVLISYMKK